MTSINLAAGDSTTVTISNPSGNPSGSTVFKTSDATVVSITKIDDNSALVKGIGVGAATITITTGIVAVEQTATIPVTITAAELRSIGVTPPMPQLAHATMLQMSAVGIYSDSSSKDLTAQVAWTSDTTDVASVDSDGIVLAGAAGTANITATLGAIHGAATITVTQATLTSIAVTPPNQTFGVSVDQQLTATGTFSDATTQDLTQMVDWTSSADVTATVDGNGLVHGVAAGTATITATLGTISGSTGVTITPAVLNTIEVDPATPTIAYGGQQQFTAIGHYSDGLDHDLTTMVTWSSDTVATATIDPATGLASAVAAGTATITATLGAVNGSTLLTVSPAVLQTIVVTPNGSSLAMGRTLQFTAMGIYTDTTMQDITTTVTWTSTAGATISNAAGTQGLATAAAVGTPTITATLGAIHGDAALTVTAAELVSIQITPVAPSAPINYIVQLTAMGTYSDATVVDLTTQVFWDSTDLTTVEVSNANGSRGLATTFMAGAPTVSATLMTTSGPVTGTAVFTVSNVSLDSIDVTPANPLVPLGLTQQFTATGVFSDATTLDLTTMVAWASGTPANAAISNAAGSQGLATTEAPGTSLITATFGPISGASTLTVNPAELTSVTISPTDPSIAPATTQQFTATGHYTDATTTDLTTTVTWTSSAPATATIDPATGLATAVAHGSTTITAMYGAFTPSTTLTVAATLVSIAVSPATPSIAKGLTQQFVATGTFSDSSTQDLTTQVAWSSSDGSAAISNTAGSQGLATGLAVGTPTITATLGTISGTTTLTVTAAVVVSIAVTPANATVTMGGATQAYVATGTFSDATTQNITSNVTWTTGLAATATVGATTGVVSGVAVGSTTVIATQPVTMITGNANVNVVALQIKAFAPADGVSNVKTGTSVGVSFDRSITAASITVQAADGACSGTFQVSTDDFTNCIGLMTQLVTVNVVTYQTLAPLAAATTYKIRVLGTITNGATTPVPLGADVAQTLGWKTTNGGTCASPLVISQVYGAGGNGGAVFTNDYVELHNRGAVAEPLGGTALQYASSIGSSWTVLALPSVSIPAGGYYLVQLAGGANGTALPTADFTGTIGMSATAGKIALTVGAVAENPLTCPLAETLDFVGFGIGATTPCFEGTAPTANLSTTLAAIRNNNGCDDTDANNLDFTVTTLTAATPPRNSASTAVLCPTACP
ncbi:MAG: Ig-like domain-containing protein [Kofleriaceae bacterium]